MKNVQQFLNINEINMKKNVKGMKYDQEKLPYDLLPMDIIDDIVRVQQYGAKKYSPNSWQHVKNGKKRYIAAALRHISQFQQGEYLDNEPGGSGLPHLTHALCSLIYAHWIDKKYRKNHKKII